MFLVQACPIATSKTHLTTAHLLFRLAGRPCFTWQLTAGGLLLTRGSGRLARLPGLTLCAAALTCTDPHSPGGGREEWGVRRGSCRPVSGLVTPLLSSSRSEIPPTGATRCPWRPHVSTARHRPRSTAWSSARSPSGWLCAGSWTAGCCEWLTWAGGSGRDHITLVPVHPPPWASYPQGPGAQCLSTWSSQRAPRHPVSGLPAGGHVPPGTFGHGWRHFGCHHGCGCCWHLVGRAQGCC